MLQYFAQHLTPLLIAWGCLTAVLVLLLIRRSTLSMHEDDQLFLTESEAHMQREQVENMQRMQRLTPLVRIFGALSGILIVAIAVFYVYGQMNPQ
jgi:hypothetical protein